jgi:hypothetical protein
MPILFPWPLVMAATVPGGPPPLGRVPSILADAQQAEDRQDMP